MSNSLPEHVNTVVIGAGQAGIAMSEHLQAASIDHVVLERARIAEAWRTGRWDSLVANGPAWHDRFPNLEFDCVGPDGFPGKEDVADYFERYAQNINAPVHCGVDVTHVSRCHNSRGFQVVTSHGTLAADNIVVATGPFQQPVIPKVIPSLEDQAAPLQQIHSYHYRNPSALPDGGVLVVGAGSSGAQIADELARAGRAVTLSVGPHDRPPRQYRGRDFVWWLGVLGKWDIDAMEPGREHITIAVSGAYGGQTVDFRRLAAEGITLVGMTQTYHDGVLTFAPDLVHNVNEGDKNYLALLDEADAYVAAYGLDLPEDPEARKRYPEPPCMQQPITSLNLAAANITTVIWATGYATDYSWLAVDAFDKNGKPKHLRGVSSAPGVHFVGLPWQSRRGSAFIWGVWHDARHIANHIVTQQSYINYTQGIG